MVGKYLFSIVNFVVLISAFNTEVVSSSTHDNIFCYFGSWARWRNGNGRFTVEDINPNLCTHITVSFIGLNQDGSVAILDTGDLLPTFINLKNKNPNVKLLVSMGGWNEGSAKYSMVIGDESLRKTLIQNIYTFLLEHKIDGLDFDWEYPAQRGGLPIDKKNYIKFLKELREQFSGTNLLITAAVGVGQKYIDSSYDVPNMNRYLDFINLMTYDYHGSWDSVTGQNSPLYPSSMDSNRELNQQASIRSWLNAGASSNKLLLGVGFYGRSFTLANPSDTRIGAKTIGPGKPGAYSQEPGMLTYLEICEQLKSKQWTTVWDAEQKTPYSYAGNQWVGYDNIDSIKIKSQFAKENRLGGVMIWSIESDDHRNVCGHGEFPLLNTINNILNSETNEIDKTEPLQSMSTEQPEQLIVIDTPPQTNSVVDEQNNECHHSGFIRNANNCNIFYQCYDNGANGWVKHKFECPAGLYFELNGNYCQYPKLVKDCQ